MATSKKNTKAAQHVDERETFVSISLQENKSDLSVEDKLKTLYEIQKTDSLIDQIDLTRGELPDEVNAIDVEIQDMTERSEALKGVIKSTEKEISDYEKDIKESTAITEKYTQQQKDAANNRQYESFSKEIEFQDLQRQLLNKKIAKDKDLVAEKKIDLETLAANLKGRKVDLADKQKELESINEDTSKERKKYQDKVDKLTQELNDERLIAAYHRVRSSSKNKLAVVTVHRDACGGCFNKIPPQRQIDIETGKKIVVCEYCGRILVSSTLDADSKKEE
jgi:predicted  nucleic acid-binding Zn-ribbon protein